MSSKIKNKGRCCGETKHDSACCGSQSAARSLKYTQAEKRRLDIDFMYLDLSGCTRCKGTDSSLQEAVAEAGRVLETTGVQVVVHKIHVKSEAQAAELGFVVSPTIRVNGRDI